jgi:hypothetical protein
VFNGGDHRSKLVDLASAEISKIIWSSCLLCRSSTLRDVSAVDDAKDLGAKIIFSR